MFADYIWIRRQLFKDYSILIGCEVPDINYFLMLIKHYFFSQFYSPRFLCRRTVEESRTINFTTKKNKSLQIKAFSKLKSWYRCSFNISIIHNQIHIDELHSEDTWSSWYYLTHDNKNSTCILEFPALLTCVRGIPKYTCYLEIIKWTKILGQENKQD